MGRGKTNHGEYQVKNTFVELVAAPEDAEFSRAGARAASANDVDNMPTMMDDSFMAKTPSPFLHPAHAPDTDALLGMAQLPGGYELQLPDTNMSIAFGDMPADFSLSGFDETNGVNYNQAMMYDPSSGMYMAYDWQMPYNAGYGMMDMQGGIPEDYQIAYPMQQDGANNHTEHLLAALSEKLAAGKGQGPEDNAALYGLQGYDMPEAMGMQGYEAYLDPASEIYPAMDLPTTIGHHEHGQQMGERSSRKNRNRDRGERGDRGDGRANGGEAQDASIDNEALNQGSVNFTTVMFRNIPNKYTREMLVQQLEENLKGLFDFVYLPIDFKNKCNVGYAFINFRTIEACEIFLSNFNGVEVRKCLPGLNSRKVTEVTPARVQGFEENVQRLRNSPVMRELAHHVEWMPLIFDENGIQVAFPAPERPLEPIKPRRRGREDSARD